MIGWKVIARNKEGKKLLFEKYDQPGRGDRAVSKVKKVSSDPLTYEVLLKNRLLGKFVAGYSQEMVDSVYKSFAKASNKSKTEIKRLLKVEVS